MGTLCLVWIFAERKLNLLKTQPMNTAIVDKQINEYLSVLNIKQKKAVLTVVKTFAEEQENHPYSDDFKKELDDRYEEYKNGGEFLTEEEMNSRIENIIKGKNKK